MKILTVVCLSLAGTAVLLLAGCGSARPRGPAGPQRAAHQPAPSPAAPDHLSLARELMDQGHYDVALVQLGQVDRRDPRKSEVIYLTGICRLESGDLQNAAGTFQQVIARDDRFAPAFNGMGLTLARQGEHEKSLPFFRRALALDPAKAGTCNNLGYALMQTGQPAEAEPVLRRCLAIDPGFTTARNNLAVCLGLLHKDEQALELLRQTYSQDVALHNMRAIRRMRAETVCGDPRALSGGGKQCSALP